jgi:membrane fusion protein, multidrug efflux system
VHRKLALLGLMVVLLPLKVEAQDLQSLNPDEIFGQLRSRNITTLSSEIAAKTDSIPFRNGESFLKGDVLVSFDCGLYQARENKAQAILNGASKKHAAEKRLAKLGSGGQLDVDLAAAKVEEARADLQIAKQQTSKCVLIAPYDGRVVQQRAGEHQFMQTGAAVIDIVEEGVLEIEFLVPSKRVVGLKKGSAFRFHVMETDKTYPAVILRRGALVDPISRTISMIGTLTGEAPDLIAGMSGQVLLEVDK